MTRDRFAGVGPSLWRQAKRKTRRPGRLFAAFLTGLCVASLAAGCADEKKLTIIASDWDSFEQQVLKSPQPVVIEFSKDPCPPCVSQKGELAKLVDQFGGQVTFATLTLVQGEFQVTCPKIEERYKILWLPTTILFFDGKEQKRWENLHNASGIAEELKQALLDASTNRPRPAAASVR